jgi:hypothetical protein
VCVGFSWCETKFRRTLIAGDSRKEIVVTIDKERVLVESEKEELPLEIAEEVLGEVDESLTQMRSKSPAKHEYGHLVAHYSTTGGGPENPIGNRLLVDYLAKRAYHMGAGIDNLVLTKGLHWETHYGKDHKQWCTEQGLTLVQRPPTSEELAS